MKNFFLVLLAILPCLMQAQTPKNTADRPLFDKKSIGEIRITLPNNNWVDQLDSMRIYSDNTITGSVMIDGTSYTDAGIRFRGDKSYQMGLKRNPFGIKLNAKDKTQNHQGYTSLKLSSALRDPSMVREMMFYEIAAKYLPTPQACYTKLYVNNEYIGIFVNVESVDGPFLRKNFGSDNRPFFKAGVDYKPQVPSTCKNNLNGSLEFEENLNCYKSNFEMNSAQGWNTLQELTRVLNFDVKNIEKDLDVDRVLWMLALNNVMVNLNSYSGSATNYYLYQDNHGQFQPIMWDLNLSFGGYKNTGTGSDLDIKALQRLDPLLHIDNPYRPLISQLLKNELHKKIYLSHVRQIVNENFAYKSDAYEKRARDFQAMIAVPYNDDKFKQYSLDEFKNNITTTVGKKSKIPGIVELMSARSKFLYQHPELTPLPSAIKDITQQVRGKFEKDRLDGFRFTATADRFPKRMWIYYRFKADMPFAALPMDEETVDNLQAGMRKFAVNIDSKSPDAEIEYYFLVENAGTVSFSPENYTIKPYKVKLSDLNK